jgi:hypothetical protein
MKNTALTEPKPIKLYKATLAFLRKQAHSVTITQKPNGDWLLTFLLEQKDKEPELCTLLTQRGEIRAWTDPRNCFAFIQECFQVKSGRFELASDVVNLGTNDRVS